MREAFVSVVIVNYNGGQYLPDCLCALKTQSRPPDEIIVVDNFSVDGSADRIAKEHPDVTLIRMDANLGFAAANNIAFEHIASKARASTHRNDLQSSSLRSELTHRWVALLNPDTIPRSDWLAALLAAARSKLDFDVFASKLISAEDPNVLDGQGDIHHVSGLSWRRHHGKRHSQIKGKPLIDPLFSPCAAAALYRFSRIREVEGMDERYFCYHEDVDLMFRLRLTGSKVFYAANSVVAHHGSAITGVSSDFSVYHGHRNLVWSYVKNMPGWLFWRYLPQHIVLNLFSVIFYSLKGRPGVILRAKFHAIKALPKVLEQRRAIQNGRTVSDDCIHRSLAKGWLTPYLFRRR